MKDILLITIFILFSVNSSRQIIPSFPFIFTLSASNPQRLFEYDITSITSPNSLMNIQFKVLNATVMTSTCLVARLVDYFNATTLKRDSFRGYSYNDFSDFMDLNGMQLDRKQYININKMANSTKLYLTVYNFDPAPPSKYPRIDDLSVQITMTPNNPTSLPVNCFDCNGGDRISNSSCGCTNCPSGYYGQDCSINMLQLSRGITSSFPIIGPQKKLFRLQQDAQVQITVKLSKGKGQVYFQFIQFQGQFASYTNVAQSDSSEGGRFLLESGTQGTKISATSSGTPMSITVAMYNLTSAQIEVYYQIVEPSNILMIVLGVLGGLLFIALVIAAIYIVKNTNFSSQPRQARASRLLPQPNLTDQEIQRFFPTVLMKNIRSLKNQLKDQQEETKQNINSIKRQQNLQQCVICLCNIQDEQQAKLTYCKHYFHSHCLMGWFKKQQNCPYCREQFNRPNAIKLYKKLKQKQNKRNLKGQQLIRAILQNKGGYQATSKNSINQIVELQTKVINIQTRNSIQIQDLNQ